MKPHEFWDSTYREVKLFVESRSLQTENDFKSYVQLIENFGNKLIGAGMTSKNPKNINLVKDVYKNLFKEELARQSAFERKASEGEDLINLMYELSEELKQETKKKE